MAVYQCNIPLIKFLVEEIKVELTGDSEGGLMYHARKKCPQTADYFMLKNAK